MVNMGGVKLSLGHLKDDLGAHIECYDLCFRVAYIVSCRCRFPSLCSISLNVSSRIWPALCLTALKLMSAKKYGDY